MNFVEAIVSKRDGGALDDDQIERFVRGAARGDLPPEQLAAMLMAICLRGMDDRETTFLTRAMLHSGETWDLAGARPGIIDKHSTGGVGDTVSLVLAPLLAAVGVPVAMMAGRGLGHSQGTLDKLEAIPGFRTTLSLDEFRAVLEEVGCAMIGQTEEIAPLDRRLYALRDVTGTVPIIPAIAASIMSKKLAEGLTGLVLDVKVGEGAFIPEEDRALDLARTMVELGERHGLATVALLTAMDRPLGRAIGNGLETAEAIACLRGEGPVDLEELVVEEVAQMVDLADERHEGGPDLSRVRETLRSGRALERFARLVRAQGGDTSILDHPGRLRTASARGVVEAKEPGTVEAIAARALGEGVVNLGGGRRRMDETIDPGVGFELAVQVGQEVQRGQPLGVVHAGSEDALASGEAILRGAVRVARDASPDPRRLVSHRVTVRGVDTLE